MYGLMASEVIIKEKWKDIKKYKGYYQVSNLGRVKRLFRSTITSILNHKTWKYS